MKTILHTLGLIIKIFLVTFIMVHCFAGLYGLFRFSNPLYHNNKPLLKSHAVSWGVRMTSYLFLFVVFGIIANNNYFIHNFIIGHLDGFLQLILLFAFTMLLGFLSGFFTILD